MQYYIISGELSGDLYGAYLINALKQLNSNAQFTCWGGRHMREAGGDVVIDLNAHSFMGVWNVLKNIRNILNNFFMIFSSVRGLLLFSLLIKLWICFLITVLETISPSIVEIPSEKKLLISLHPHGN